jgi:uncharacterized iron-regulated membrane protein
MSGRAYDLLIVVHRWVALVTSIFILILGATGGALVFEGAIDRGLNPSLWRVTPGERPVSIDSMLSSARAAVPTARISGITLPPVADRAALVQAGGTQVFVNPFTGTVQGRRTATEWNATLPRRLHALHVTLMAGVRGNAIVAATTAVSLFLVLTGVIVWWRDKLWRIHWSASWKRIVFDLHHSLGVIAAIALLLITASGVVMHYPRLNDFLRGMDSTPPPAVPRQPTAAAGTESVSADSVYRTAMRVLPGARVMFLSLPSMATQPFLAAMRFPEDHTPGGRSRVFVDRFTGAVLLASSTREAQLGTRIGNQLRSIHTGDVFGKPSEAIWLAAAIILVNQALSGVLMWWNARRGRRVVAARAGNHGPARAQTATTRT